MKFSLPERDGLIKMLSDDDFDLVVVGGGITGAGILRDAALRGLKAALVERGDFASGTSSRSSKLIHGGLRYLEQFKLGLVFESTHERARLLRLAPNIVRPLPFLMPIYRSSPHGMFKMNMGMWLYDMLATFRNYKMHKRYRKEALLSLEPGLCEEGLRGGMHYFDAMTDDARLTLVNILDAFSCGAVPMNHLEARSIEVREGRISELEVYDRATGDTFGIKTRCIVCAAGPWTESVLGSIGCGECAPRLRPTKGSHIVLSRRTLPLANAVVMTSPVDGRVMFALPWQGATLVGTTDTDHEGDTDDIFADRADVEYLLSSVRQYFPSVNASISDVIGTWSGLRPLINEEGLSPSQISREHLITTDRRGIVSIAGGKLTTYRVMAAEALEAAQNFLGDGNASRSPTGSRPLPYSHGLDSVSGLRPEIEKLIEEFPVSRDSALHLVSSFGCEARGMLADAMSRDKSLLEPIKEGIPVLRFEAIHAAAAEMALDLESFLCRRTPFFFLDPGQGRDVAGDVADLMGGVLGWDAARKEEEVAALNSLADSHMAFLRD